MFDALFSGLAGLLAFYYELVPSYVFAITLLTLTVMAITTPFTWKSTRSMLAMQRLQPEMKRIQQEFKHDRQQMNEELMAFYKEHKINPLGGCLPMVLQMPVFIVMYNVISGLTRTTNGRANPKYLEQTSDLYVALVESGGRMLAFGVDLAKRASETAPPGTRFALVLLVGASAITQYIQTKRMSSRSSQAGTNPQMQMINRIMPIFIGFISLSMPGAVVLYFVVQNLFRIGQQELMYKYDPTLAEHAAKEREKIREARATTVETPRERKGLRTDAAALGNGRPERARNGATPPPRPGNGRATPKGGGHGRATPKRPKKGR